VYRANKIQEELEADLKKYDSLKPADPPEAQTIVDAGREAPKSHVLAVGNWDVPKEEVQPGFLSILDPADPKIAPPEGLNSSGRRTVLANWLADPRNPLTTRVMVNRVWHYHFGHGIVGSSAIWRRGVFRPANPQLLDYLAAKFVEDGWSIKKLTRAIMLSNTYQSRPASARGRCGGPDMAPNGATRGIARRVREIPIPCSTSGLLNPKMGGPGVHPTCRQAPCRRNTETGSPRRILRKRESPQRLVFEKRVMVYLIFEADAPNLQESCARRFRTVIPSQALMLMNDGLVLEWSRTLAGRVLNDGGLTAAQQIERAYRLALSRSPSSRERQEVLGFLGKQSALIGERLSQNEKVALPDHLPQNIPAARAAAFVDFCHALLNSNEFLYVN
jgi:hypothetical protein